MAEDFTIEKAQQYLENGDYNNAAEILKNLIFYDRSNVKALYLLALVYYRTNEYDFALNLLERVLQFEPENCDIVVLSGTIFGKTGRHNEAEKYFRKALRLNPTSEIVNKNLALALQNQNKFDEAVSVYKKLLSEYPADATIYNDFGYLLQNIALYDNAQECFERAIVLNPEYALAHWNLSLILLRKGDFERGFSEYEWGFSSGFRTLRKFSKLRWSGEPLHNARLLVSHEQGLGDSLMFSRYLQLLDEKNINYVFEVPRELMELYKASSLKCELVPLDTHGAEPFVMYDYYIPLLSLPKVLKSNVSSTPRSLEFSLQKHEVDNQEQFNVGICWKGGSKHLGDTSRSMSLRCFQPLIDKYDVNFVSLQKNLTDEESLFLYRNHIDSQVVESTDLKQTAELINQMDLVITVDTAVAHVASTLGKNVWLLLQPNADWRWLIDKNFTIWYENVRLYRKSISESWQDLMQKVINDFEKIYSHYK